MTTTNYTRGIVALSVLSTPSNPYATSFPTIETVLSENGYWITGLATGLDWTDPRVDSHGARCTQTGTNSPVTNDSIAVLTGTNFGPNQTVSMTVRTTDTPVSDFEELEVLMRFKITAHTARGYELNWSTSHNYCELVRWNGAFNDFTHIDSRDIGNPVTGDVLKAVISGTSTVTVAVYKNDVHQIDFIDNGSLGGHAPWTDGNPGIGSFYQLGGPDGSVLNYSITHYTASAT